MKFSVETITPAKASEYLATVSGNRRVAPNTVARYARDMREDNWQNNAEPIKFSPEGKLLDGQHRLHAVVASGKSIEAVVIRDVPEETFVTMDTGRQRQFSDILSIGGAKEPMVAASCARIAWNYISGASLGFNPTRKELNSFVEAHPYVLKAAEMLQGRPHRLPKGPLAALVFIVNERGEHDPDIAEFLHGLYTGTNLSRGDPRFTLREWLINTRITTGKKMDSAVTFAAMVRAWNAFTVGRELLLIKQVDSQTRDTLPLIGFHPEDFKDVPNVPERAVESRMAGLKKAQESGGYKFQKGDPRSAEMGRKGIAAQLVAKRAAQAAPK